MTVSQTSTSLLWFPFRGATTYYVVRDGVTVFSGSQMSRMVDKQGLLPGTRYKYAMYADFGGTSGSLGPTIEVVTLNTSVPEGELRCASDSGFISELNYQPNSDKTCQIAPALTFELLTLRVSA